MEMMSWFSYTSLLRREIFRCAIGGISIDFNSQKELVDYLDEIRDLVHISEESKKVNYFDRH